MGLPTLRCHKATLLPFFAPTATKQTSIYINNLYIYIHTYIHLYIYWAKHIYRPNLYGSGPLFENVTVTVIFELCTATANRTLFQVVHAPLALVWSMVHRFHNPQAYELHHPLGSSRLSSKSCVKRLDDETHVLVFTIKWAKFSMKWGPSFKSIINLIYWACRSMKRN